MPDFNHSSPETTAIGITRPDYVLSEGPQLSEEEIAAIKALPAESALLIAQDGLHKSSRFLLDAEMGGGKGETGIVAGRHPEADVFLDDVTVSRRHAVFQFNAGSFELTDTGSLNGTYVNSDRVDSAVLKDGDEVRIGKFVFVFYASRATK